MKIFPASLIVLVFCSCGFGQGNLFYWTGLGDGTTWTQAANWTLPAPLPYGEPGGSSTWPGELAEGDYAVFNNGGINIVTNVPTCTLGRLEVNRFESVIETFVYLSGYMDGSKVSMKSPSPYIIAEGTQWIVRIGEMCVLDMNQGMAPNRVKLICQPGAHAWQQNYSEFIPAEFPDCDGQKGFLLKANDYNHAEFIPQEYVYQNVKGWAEYCIPVGQFHYISPPVTSTWPATGEFENQFCRKHNSLGVFNGDYLRWYDNIACSPWGWCEWISNVSWFDPILNIETGRGYEYYGTPGSDPLHAFYGTFNSGQTNSPISLPINSQGWNLVGNPFPSAIVFDESCGGTAGIGWYWDLDYIDPVAYYWDNSLGGYHFYNWHTGVGNGPIGDRVIIPRSQGFFVHVSVFSPPASDIKIINPARRFRGVHQIGKCLVANYLQVILNDGSGNYHDDAVIGFKEEVDGIQFDRLRDAHKLFNDPDRISQLYFKTVDNVDLAMKSLKLTTGNINYPLYMKVVRTGTYSMEFKDLNSFSPNTGIILKDNKTNATVDLKVNPVYTFTATSGDDDARFTLCFSDVIDGVQNPEDNTFQVYTHDHSIYIRSNTLDKISGTVSVYDLIGRIMMEKDLTGETIMRIETSLNDGFYLVSVKTNRGVCNRKVYITCKGFNPI